MAQPTSTNGRMRARSAIPEMYLGRWPTGPLNSLTDVPGVLVHTESIQSDRDINTGLTTILPGADWAENSHFAGIFRFNGCGELTGSHWIEETGLLTAPVLLTSTGTVGDAFRGMMEYCYRFHKDEEGEMPLFLFPVVGETYDGFLSDMGRFPLTTEHVIRGIQNATSDRVPEGNTGGGTGMICHRFKGGTGSSSRVIKGVDESGNDINYTVAALVQANYGAPDTLHIGGVPVGHILKKEKAAQEADAASGSASSAREVRKDGSIIIILATDAPLLPVQLQRLAKRATVGLGKVGGYGNNTSGDIFLAFSTANKIPMQEVSMSGKPARPLHPHQPSPMTVQMSDNDSIDGLFEGAADATEEAIYNALFMATDMTGNKGRVVEAMDIGKIKEIVEKRL